MRRACLHDWSLVSLADSELRSRQNQALHSLAFMYLRFVRLCQPFSAQAVSVGAAGAVAAAFST